MRVWIVFLLVLIFPLPGFGEVTCQTMIIRGQDYTESIFYDDGKEVARVKQFVKGKVEKQGEVPDGQVKFKDSYRQTYGEEYYRGGRKMVSPALIMPTGS